MNHKEFETLLNVKQKDLDLKKLADDISADILKNNKDKHAISHKFLVAHNNLKPAQFRKFCKLIPVSKSVGYRHVKVAEFLNAEEGRAEKFKHIESWDTLHALSLLKKIEYLHFMFMIGDKGEHFTKADVEKYNRELRKIKLKNEAIRISRESMGLSFCCADGTLEEIQRDLKKLYDYSKTLPSIVSFCDFDHILKQAKTLKQAELEANEDEIEENRWYLVHINKDIDKLKSDLRLPDADEAKIENELNNRNKAIKLVKKWIDELQVKNEQLAVEEGIETENEIHANDDDFYLPEMYRKRANDQ